MEIVKKVLMHSDFIKYIQLNMAAEGGRKFCRHDLQHAVDVARVAYIISLERALGLSKELIYVTALLHDIGRWKQYEDKSDHAEEGAKLAGKILEALDFDRQDMEMIMEAIAGHRSRKSGISLLGEVIYEGDKSCRPCFNCAMVKECNWYSDGDQPELLY